MARAALIWWRFLVPLFSIGAAHAQDLPNPNATESAILIQPLHAAAVSSFDADSIGNRSVYLGGTFAPLSGIYESGVRFRVTGSANLYRFLTSEDPRTVGSGRYLEGDVLAGYGIWLPRFSITWLVGPSFGESVNEGVTQDQWGAKAIIELYARPTDLTMASSSVSYSTVANKIQVQAKAGLKLLGDIYFGPEAKLTWQQILPWQINFASSATITTTPVSPQSTIATMHVGAHLSAANIGPALMGISGGWANDRQLGSGYYGSVNFYRPF
jgi:Cellulose biosynthesis protein BcsS